MMLFEALRSLSTVAGIFGKSDVATPHPAAIHLMTRSK